MLDLGSKEITPLDYLEEYRRKVKVVTSFPVDHQAYKLSWRLGPGDFIQP